MTPLGASSSAPPAGPAANALDVIGWFEAGATVVQPVQPTPAGDDPHAYLGHEPAPTAVSGGQPVSVTALLTVLVAAVFAVRLGMTLTRKIVATVAAAEPRQHADGDAVASPTAVAVGAGRDF